MILCNITNEDATKQIRLVDKLNARGFYNLKVSKQALTIDTIKIAEEKGYKFIICSNPDSIANLVPQGEGVSQQDWRGSVIFYSVPVLIINPLMHLYTTDTGEFILNADLDKVSTILSSAVPFKKWLYSYCLCNSSTDITEARTQLLLAEMLVCDIETTKDNRISDISITPITDWNIGQTYQIQLLPENYATLEDWRHAWLTVAHLLKSDIPKCFHNGTFDAFQLSRYNLIVNNWLFDTEYLWYSWYAELKKSLAFISSILLPDYLYWKKSAESDPRGYNAKDTINTARCLIALLKTMPDWAKRNYAKVIPNAWPAIYMNFEGFKVNTEMKEAKRDEAIAESTNLRKLLQTYTGSTAFNPNSPPQVSFYLYKIFGAKKLPRAKSVTGTDEKSLKALRLDHPLLARFCDAILSYRKATKAYTTYYEAKLFNARLLYSINIDGTETGRMASSKSVLYAPNPKGTKKEEDNYGAQIQNQPGYAKAYLIADNEFLLGNIDKSQSEARCTAYLSGDQNLLNDLYRSPTEEEIQQYDGDYASAGDFYVRCTYRYFGVRINKSDARRKITKRVNHGTSYMMQEFTFIDSVGIENMLDAKQMLNRPKGESLKHFATFLLSRFHEPYSGVKPWWNDIKLTIAKQGWYETPDGWRRIFFGDILKKPQIWRGAVAHVPQHFSVAGINTAMYRLFYNLQLPSNGDFRLKCQVHDSITYQAKKAKLDWYTMRVLEIMDIPQPVRPGVVMRIPLDVETGPSWKTMKKWNASRHPCIKHYC